MQRLVFLSVIPICFLDCQSPVPRPEEPQSAFVKSAVDFVEPKKASFSISLEKILRVPTDFYPKQICLHPERNEIYVTNLGNHETSPYSDGSLQIFDLKTGALLYREEAKAAVECLVDEKNPNILYYTDMFRDEVVKFEIPSRKILWKAPVKEDTIPNLKGHKYRFMPKIVHKDSTSARLYVSLWLDGVSILDDKSGKLIRRVPKFCSLPRGLLYWEGTLHVLCYGIGENGIGEIIWLNPESGEITNRISTGGSPRHIVPYRNNLAFVSNLNSGEVYLYELSSGNILKSIKTGSANTIVLDPKGNYLYISERTRNQILILDIEKWLIVERIAVGRFPTGLGIRSDGEYLAITNFHDGNYDLFRIHRNYEY